MLVQPSLFGQYGKIMSISVKKNKSLSKKHYDSAVYSAYITYQTEIEASLCILSVDGKELGGQKLGASYGMTKYCSYFLENQNCRNDNCLFLHKSAAEEDCFSLYDKQSRGYPTRSSKEDIFNLVESKGQEAFFKYRDSMQKIIKKMKKEQEDEMQFNSDEEESDILDVLPSPIELFENLKQNKPKLFEIKNKPERENQSLKSMPDKIQTMSINKSWHFPLMKKKSNDTIDKKKINKQSKRNYETNFIFRRFLF
jgi:hypothetical protein